MAKLSNKRRNALIRFIAYLKRQKKRRAAS